jgi:hypothetical protein
MQDQISKPIRPFEQLREYIPTQIVAEYLREVFGCKGIIYKSSVHRSEDRQNKNIVIFGNAEEFVGSSPNLLTYLRSCVKEVANIRYDVQERLF